MVTTFIHSFSIKGYKLTNTMKKFFTLSVGLCFAISAFAQKDVEITLISPKTGDKIYVMEALSLTYSVKNVGVDVLTATDSIFVNMKMDGDYVLGAFYHRYVPHNTLAVGDSVFYTISFVFTQQEIDDFPFCFELETSNNGQPFDSQSANNESCAMITVDERTAAGIEDVKHNGVKLYPNPATNTITIESSLLNVSKAVITDVLGAVKTEVDYVTGSSLSVNYLSNGIYFCRLTDDANNIVGIIKFIVAR